MGVIAVCSILETRRSSLTVGYNNRASARDTALRFLRGAKFLLLTATGTDPHNCQKCVRIERHPSPLLISSCQEMNLSGLLLVASPMGTKPGVFCSS